MTRTYYHGLDASTGRMVIVSRGEDHEKAPMRPGYTRMQMTIGANILSPMPSDPKKTRLTLLTHVNPGGLANTQFGAMVTNKLSAESPRQFIKKFNEVATGVTVKKKPRFSLVKKRMQKLREKVHVIVKKVGVTALLAASFSVLGRLGGSGGMDLAD